MARFDRMFNDTGVKRAEPHPKREIKWLHYTKLVDHQAQYCNEKSNSEIEILAGLIDAEKGVLQPLLVRKVDTDEYEIIAGHKRRRACKYLVEEEGKEQYQFLPCIIENLSDVRAEFQLYSSNRFHEKDDYEKMHELERMKYLLETYPEEFPHLKTGRMVERLAKQMGMKRTTVGEYLTISNNLGNKGKEEFKSGKLKKSAAVELSSLQEQEQEELIEQGITSYKEIKSYKECKNDGKEKVFQEEDKQNEEVLKQEPEPGDQLTGQYKVVNTEMDVEEDVPHSDVQVTVDLEIPEVSGHDNPTAFAVNIVPEEDTVNYEESPREKYTPRFFLNEQKEKLDDMIHNKEKGNVVPDKLFERQRTIVCALAIMVMELEKEQPIIERYSGNPDCDKKLVELLKATQKK